MNENAQYSLLKLIGSLTSDGIFVYNTIEKNLEYVNHAMVRIFDISHDAFRYQPDFFVNHVIREDIDHLLEEYENLKMNSVVENVEFHLKLHDKAIRTICCNAYMVDSHAVGFVRDITTQRENERYVVNYGAKKDALLDMISHNLTAPLNLTHNMLESLSARIVDSDVNIRHHLRFIRESTAHCIEIVNDFLKDEHLTSEHISVKHTRFDVIEKINFILDGVRLADSEKELVLSSDVARLYANLDEVKFMQIVQNLVSNAVKFTQPDGRINVRVNQMARSFSVAFEDNGIGIPDRLKPVLFEKYTPASRPGLRGEPSIGMGLYIVRKLVSILNGKITFESSEGKGSTFVIQFLLE